MRNCNGLAILQNQKLSVSPNHKDSTALIADRIPQMSHAMLFPLLIALEVVRPLMVSYSPAWTIPRDGIVTVSAFQASSVALKCRARCLLHRDTLQTHDLPCKDSNLNLNIQSVACYHYTTRQRKHYLYRHPFSTPLHSMYRLSELYSILNRVPFSSHVTLQHFLLASRLRALTSVLTSLVTPVSVPYLSHLCTVYMLHLEPLQRCYFHVMHPLEL